MEQRPYDIVLFGATGFTGGLTAEYLAKNYKGMISWAIAGRNAARLAEVKASLDDDSVSVLVGDVSDQASIDRIVAATRVIATTVGPYMKYGTPIVDACARLGTHYVDLTGEAAWIRTMIDKYHDIAGKSGACIVHSCGFDSIPSDLGTLLVVDHARKVLNRPIEQVKLAHTKGQGGVSGGTLASGMEALNDLKTMNDVNNSPAYLNPRSSPPTRDQRDVMSVSFDKDLGLWIHAFPLAGPNSRIVRRSNALSNPPYGNSFIYQESAGTRSLIKALTATFAFAVVVFLLLIRPIRLFAAKYVFPQPGSGPSAETRANGFFEATVLGITEPEGPQNKRKLVKAKVVGHGDPGYQETSKMLAEAALCLALQRNSLQGSHAQGGVITPASCMGMTLVERLRAAGMEFDIVSTTDY